MLSKMKYWLMELGAYFLIYSGIAHLYLTRRIARGEVTAFFLHDPKKEVFEKIILKARAWGFEFINDQQLIDYLNGKEIANKRFMHLSVDDGWRNNLKTVAPFAEAHNIPITYFISTEPMESGDFWWNKVPDFATAARLRAMPNAGRMEYLRQLSEAAPQTERTAMTPDEVKALSGMRHATIGNHTHNHPMFSHCSDQEMEYELTEAHLQLQRLIEKPVTSFAYPCGAVNGYEQEVLRRLGYQVAYSTDPRGVRKDEPNRFDIPRFEDNNRGGPAENFCRMIGLWETIYHWLRLRYKGIKRLPVLGVILQRS
ncbi:peptidoglycan/xylan/chitin deacetylase (PgdA/CDA1 family) [Oxalobacteraceae bacterium GrIS 2.11]